MNNPLNYYFLNFFIAVTLSVYNSNCYEEKLLKYIDSLSLDFSFLIVPNHCIEHSVGS